MPKDIAIKIINSIIALTSACIAFFLYRIQKSRPWVDALFSISNRMETRDMREIREYIYKLISNRENSDFWNDIITGKNDKYRRDIDQWGAEMDILSLLFSSDQLNKIKFFELYGDVLIRSAYNLAPYVNSRRKKRGDQFWLPFQNLIIDILKIWSKRAKKNKYPNCIGFPDYCKTEFIITLDKFTTDTEINEFLNANNIRWKIKHKIN